MSLLESPHEALQQKLFQAADESIVSICKCSTCTCGCQSAERHAAEQEQDHDTGQYQPEHDPKRSPEQEKHDSCCGVLDYDPDDDFEFVGQFFTPSPSGFFEQISGTEDHGHDRGISLEMPLHSKLQSLKLNRSCISNHLDDPATTFVMVHRVRKDSTWPGSSNQLEPPAQLCFCKCPHNALSGAGSAMSIIAEAGMSEHNSSMESSMQASFYANSHAAGLSFAELGAQFKDTSFSPVSLSRCSSCQQFNIASTDRSGNSDGGGESGQPTDAKHRFLIFLLPHNDFW